MHHRWQMLLLLAGLAACQDAPRATLELAANATYAGILDEPISLIDGRFDGEPFLAGASSRPGVRLLDEPVGAGDLDGDGIDELAVVLVSSFGGSGTFAYLAIVDAQRGPTEAVLLGDRVQVRSLSIANRVIEIDTLEHAAGDAMCCPGLARHRQWTLQHNVLTETLAAEPQAAYRGHLTIGHEVRTFVECDTAREAWLIDRTDGDLRRAVDALASEPYEPVFVEISASWRAAPEAGFGADFDAAIEVDELLRAEREGFGCNLDTAGFSFRAMGNEPSWRVDIDARGMHFRFPDRQLESGQVESVSGPGGSIRLSGAVNGMPVKLVLDEQRCTDSMSGAWYSYTALASVGSDTYSGCAIEGSLPLN